jgi:hypothetical protein
MRNVTSQWQRRRSAFNHDWLKNRYMPALAKYLNLLDGRLEDPAFERSFVSNILPEWVEHCDEAFALARDFEGEISPRRLFDSLPLSRCDEATKEWMGKLIHGLWLKRNPVKQWIIQAVEATERAESAYQTLRACLENCADARLADATRSHRLVFAAFRARCQDLANAISIFPSEVKVI